MADQVRDDTVVELRPGFRFGNQNGAVGVDPQGSTPHDKDMSDFPTRGEIDAKLAAAEARTETRFAELRADMDARFSRLDNKFDTLLRAAEGWGEEMRETRRTVVSENRSTRQNMWIAAIAAILAVIGAVYSIHSLNLASQANLLSAFQAKEAGSKPQQ